VSPDSRILGEMDEARRQAISDLGRYKFWMFGYHAARWVTLNRLLPEDLRQPNPFRRFVQAAREEAG
jgi:hypothetical protein